MINNTLKGGSEIEFDLLKKYVNIENINIHIIPNSFSSSLYHIDNVNQKEKNIIWAHQSYDTVESFSIQHQYDFVDKIVFVSNWQERKYVETFKIKEDKNVVIENGIEPIPNHVKPKSGKINLIYTSTPYRGLDVLLQSFQYIQHMNIHLHIFSSMKIYNQNNEDIKYERMYDFCKKHPKITYHGSVNNETIRDAFRESHILAYPSTFEETSCISVIEAMSAQCAVVCSNLGALPETTNRFANMYCFEKDKIKHAKLFSKHLEYTIENYNQSNYKIQKQFFDLNYSWEDTIKNKWEKLIKELSTKKQKMVFNYV